MLCCVEGAISLFMDFVHTAIQFLSADENDIASIPYNHKAVHRTRLTFRKLMKSNIHARKHHKHPEPRSTVSAILLRSFEFLCFQNSAHLSYLFQEDLTPWDQHACGCKNDAPATHRLWTFTKLKRSPIFWGAQFSQSLRDPHPKFLPLTRAFSACQRVSREKDFATGSPSGDGKGLRFLLSEKSLGSSKRESFRMAPSLLVCLNFTLEYFGTDQA